jgi:hypothetical protein
VCVCVCVCLFVCACVRACVFVCVCECVRAPCDFHYQDYVLRLPLSATLSRVKEQLQLQHGVASWPGMKVRALY